MHFEDWDEDEIDEKTVTVLQALREERRFLFEYDFGDSWDHDVFVEELSWSYFGLKFAVCLDGDAVGGFELGENFLTTFASADVSFALRHFFGIEQALVIRGESFGVDAVVTGSSVGRAEAAGERFVEILFAVVRRHRGLLN